MGMHCGQNNHHHKDSMSSDYGVDIRSSPASNSRSSMDYSPGSSLGADAVEEYGAVEDWIEMWDYVGGTRFRGFVAGNEEGEKAMFIFFDQSVIEGDLKAGLMALLELCDLDYFTCDRLVICMDRHADALAKESLTKDLGWIGFGLTTLDDYANGEALISDKWLFMDMET